MEAAELILLVSHLLHQVVYVALLLELVVQPQRLVISGSILVQCLIVVVMALIQQNCVLVVEPMAALVVL